MPNSTQFPAILTGNLNATIANASSLSDAIDLNGTTLVGYIIPSAWTAADITIQGSADGTNFHDLYNSSGNEIKHVVDADQFITLSPSGMACLRHIKIRSGTSSTPVNQAAQRVITLVTRSV